MKPFCVVAFLFLYTNGFSQNFLSADSTMQKAMLPEGYYNTGVPFKEFNGELITGEKFNSDSLKGKVTFMNFWFAECAPCVAEFDELNALYNKYRGDKTFQFLSFTFESKEKALVTAGEHHLNYPIICLSRDDIYNLIFNLGFPTSMITDKQGKIAFIRCGGGTDPNQVKSEINKLFSQRIETLLSSQ